LIPPRPTTFPFPTFLSTPFHSRSFSLTTSHSLSPSSRPPHLPSSYQTPAKGTTHARYLGPLVRFLDAVIFIHSSNNRRNSCSGLSPSGNVSPYPISFHFFSINARFSQGFFFDWNPPGTTVPIPTTRRLEFSIIVSQSHRRVLQSSAKPCISLGRVGLRP